MSAPSNGSSAMPTVCANVDAFLPTPGTDDGAIRSPAAISPPSLFTFTGTRPESATGTFLSASYTGLLYPPSKSPGSVDTTPRSVGDVLVPRDVLSYRDINTGFAGSSITISPAPSVWSFVG